MPTAPSAPAPPIAVSPLPAASAIVQINIIGDRFLLTPRPVTQMIARVSLSVGNFIDDTDYVSWTADPASVATIDRQGRVTAVSPGEVVVSASVGDKVGRARIRVLPDYSGTWNGDYRVFACSGAADPRTCPRNMFSESTGQPILHSFSLTLNQTEDRVSGTGFARPIPLTGIVRVSGALVLEGLLEQPPIDPVRLTNWSSRVNIESTEMAGGFTLISPYILSLGGFRGVIRTDDEFTGLTRLR